MNDELRTLWGSRAPRERAILGALAAIAGIVLYVWFVQSAGNARLQLRARVLTLRAQAADLDQQALEYSRLLAAPAATVSPTNLQTLVQARIGDAGLAGALVSINASGADQVVVAFGAVAFADWLKWIADLKAQHVRLDAGKIETLSTPGLVSVTATLLRATRQ